ncbi:amidohydrolase 2 [Sulfobacillus acidophilus TPY]|uniref:Amidohydrolase 2 n=1 Tax=Sulfobacillus acidophilus (strain ATCC 700253 / DSM 10332 / NAL) TaxID=679936 RepID=G8TZJ0_SULAD|nr:amidohydrolase 2 [Sulfobacillus acidophilus TPY]AEW05230.1 amidohydrolase 2 [Sulfobacillus acidophilus DSM 10332]
MYKTKDGDEVFIVDGHVALWDGSPANQKNRHGGEFIDCFYDYHRNLSPQEYLWPHEKFVKYDEETFVRDVFEQGYVDVAIFQPVGLIDFYREPFGNVAKNYAFAEKYPGRFVGNGYFDPRDGEEGLERLEEWAKKYHLQGVKLYTAEWNGSSRGYQLTDPWAQRYLAKCLQLGIRNIHVHKGPTIKPLNMDAFDVGDIDDAASAFPELNFIVEHVGLPRLEKFCWIATQEPNVYAGLAVANAFIYTRPRYFAQILSELLYWLNEDRILFGSDYALWHPKWLIDMFMAFEFPEDIVKETGIQLTLDIKKKILGLNAARLYNIDVTARSEQLKKDVISQRLSQVS